MADSSVVATSQLSTMISHMLSPHNPSSRYAGEFIPDKDIPKRATGSILLVESRNMVKRKFRRGVCRRGVQKVSRSILFVIILFIKGLDVVWRFLVRGLSLRHDIAGLLKRL